MNYPNSVFEINFKITPLEREFFLPFRKYILSLPQFKIQFKIYKRKKSKRCQRCRHTLTSIKNLIIK